MQKVLHAIQRGPFAKSTLRHASIQEKKGPTLGKIQVKPRHQRSPYFIKFEVRSHEETARQQRCARSKAWNLAQNMYKLKEKDKAAFHFPAEEWVLPVASTHEPEEREFVVDSGASMHMVSEKDRNSAELATMRTSRSPTTVMTANGGVRTNKEPTVYVKQFGRSQENSFIVITLYQESNCTCRKKKHFLFRWSTSTLPERLINPWMYWWRNILKIIGTWMEKENYRMHGQVSQGSSYWPKGHLMGTRGPGGDLQENNQPLVETMYGQICRRICLMQRKRKQNKDGLSRNQNSTMPDNWEEYSILDQTVKNSSSQSKPLGESWKFRCQQQSCSSIWKRKAKYACVVDADESTRPRLNWAVHKHHQDHITEKGMNSATILFANSFRCLKQWKFWMLRQQWRKEWEKPEKIPAWQLTKVGNKKEEIDEARNKSRKVHFASLMDICHLKHSELEPQYQKHRGRVVLRRDIVKDDSGSLAEFSEQGSSASQMTAAKVMDIVSTLPGCSGQAAGAVSACTQAEVEEDASTSFTNSIVRMSIFWIRLPKHKWPKPWSSMKHPVVPLERNLYGHPLAGLWWERLFEKVLLEHGWEKVFNWEC